MRVKRSKGMTLEFPAPPAPPHAREWPVSVFVFVRSDGTTQCWNWFPKSMSREEAQATARNPKFAWYPEKGLLADGVYDAIKRVAEQVARGELPCE